MLQTSTVLLQYLSWNVTRKHQSEKIYEWCHIVTRVEPGIRNHTQRRAQYQKPRKFWITLITLDETQAYPITMFHVWLLHKPSVKYSVFVWKLKGEVAFPCSRPYLENCHSITFTLMFSLFSLYHSIFCSVLSEFCDTHTHTHTRYSVAL